MRARTTVGVIVVGLMMNVACGAGFAQVSSSASSYVSSDTPAHTTIGTFIFEQGSSLVLEIEREEPCPCMCEQLFVTGLRVLGGQGNTVFVSGETGQQASSSIPYEEWTGRWDLVDQLGNPVGEGTYTIVVKTTIGEFCACVEVVAPGMATRRGQISSQASVCGIGMRLYRLIDETDNGQRVTLRQGEYLMVALSGNATTGFAWEVEAEPNGGILREMEGLGYRPSSTLLGAGGTFFFRYEAVAAGQGDLSFVYHRPWETAPPENTFTVLVVVR